MGYWNSIKSPGKVEVSPSNCQTPISANTKGSYNTIADSTIFPGTLNLIINPAYENGSFLLDLAIGSTGNEQVFLSNIYFVAPYLSYYYPQFVNTSFFIPSGSRISARGQSEYINVYIDVVAIINPFMEGFQTSLTLGADTANSKGLTIDPGAVAFTKGNWTQFSSGVDRTYKYIIFMPGKNRNSNRQYAYFDIDIGLTASPGNCLIAQNIRVMQHQYIGPNPIFSFPINIPSGSEIHVRASCNITDATDRLFDAVIILLG